MFPATAAPSALESEGFKVLERLGTGGAGQVFLASSPAGRLVAVKVLSDAPQDEEQDGRFARELAREASLCARLNHPAIVQVRAFIERGGFAALVFEYIRGIALTRLLRHRAQLGTRLPDRAAWHVMERVFSALAFAHAQHDDNGRPAPIVHRDVSPSNVLVDWGGDVKLSDFGLAKMLGAAPHTRIGLVRGTPGCMSPEQARGEDVTERADVYSAGLLAWRVATGRMPFHKYRNDEIELMRAMRNPKLKPLASMRPDLPRALLVAIDAALDPVADTRSIGAAEIVRVIRENVDVPGGRDELATLLAAWRSGIERQVVRSEAGPRSLTESRSHTLRYEEAALALDAIPDDASNPDLLPLPASNPPPGFPVSGVVRVEISSDAPPLPPAIVAEVSPSVRFRAPPDQENDSPPTRRQLVTIAIVAALAGAAVTLLVAQVVASL